MIEDNAVEEVVETEERIVVEGGVVDLTEISPMEAVFELFMTSEGNPLRSRRFITLISYLVVIFLFGAGKAVWPEFMVNYEVKEFAELAASIVVTMITGYSLQDYANKKYTNE